jgi:hypothetical protein
MEARQYYEQLGRRELPVIVDDPQLGALVRRLGFQVEQLAAYDFAAKRETPVLLLCGHLASCQRMMEHWKTSANLLMHLSAAKFDAAPAAAEYALSQILSIDAAAALARRTDCYEQLLSCGQLELHSAAGVLVCRLQNDLEIPNPGDTLEPAWLYSAVEFLEASMVNLEGERSTFVLDGDLAFDGLIHLSNSQDVKDRFGSRWDDLVRRAAAGGNSLMWRDNQLTRLVIGGTDVTPELYELTAGVERGGAATELGLGCADLPAALDWSRNALPHKSVRGAYVGIGMGWQRPHVDFIARGAQVRFVQPD